MRKKKVFRENICDESMMSFVRECELFRDITESSFQSAMNVTEPYYKDMRRNEILVRENEEFTKLAIVDSGKFVSVRSDYGGRSTMIKEFSRGDIIGLNIVFSKTKKSPTIVQATAAENRLIFIDLKSVLSPTYPDKRLQFALHTNLMRAIAEDSVKNIYKIDIVSKKTIRERVLAYLFVLMKKRQNTAFRVDMDREHLAQYLDVTRSALSHELSKMRAEGLIECERDWFSISEKCIQLYAPVDVRGNADNDPERVDNGA